MLTWMDLGLVSPGQLTDSIQTTSRLLQMMLQMTESIPATRRPVRTLSSTNGSLGRKDGASHSVHMHFFVYSLDLGSFSLGASDFSTAQAEEGALGKYLGSWGKETC